MNWIKVFDKCPDDDVLVLVKYKHVKSGVSVGKFSAHYVNQKRTPLRGNWRVLYDMDAEDCTDFDYNVSEWMPLPSCT